jgi:hypothetical protein
MLFKLLKLFGLDVPAKMAAAKAIIEQRAEEVADYAKHATQTATIIAALTACAAVLVAMALGVGLLALYWVVAESYGVNAGLDVIAGVFVVAALILFFVARTKGQSLSNQPIFKPLSLLEAFSPPPVVAVAERARVSPPPSGGPREPAGNLLEPLAVLLTKYIKYPALGHPVLDEFVGNLRATARGTADEAVQSAANFVSYGSRGQLLVMLGGAAFFGWLLARQNPDGHVGGVPS